jgi:hypothetical protein
MSEGVNERKRGPRGRGRNLAQRGALPWVERERVDSEGSADEPGSYGGASCVATLYIPSCAFV